MTILDQYPDMEKPERFDPARLQPDKIELLSPLAAESKDIAGYLRTGGCTAGCGACCAAFVIPLGLDARSAISDFADVVRGRLQVPIDPVVRGRDGFADWEQWLGLHDAWLLQPDSSSLAETRQVPCTDGTLDFMEVPAPSVAPILTVDLPVECKEAPLGLMITDEWFKWLEQSGVTLIRRHEQVLAYINRQCDELSEDGMCQIVGTARHPKMCAAYPRHPSDIDGLGFCTYKFQAVSRIELMARNIAGQGQARTRPKKKGKRKKKGR